MWSMDYVQVFEEATQEQSTPERLRDVVGIGFLNAWKGNEVKAGLSAQGYNQKAEQYAHHYYL
eukprot:11175335-Lingulodinium_polyedra.AAC.1